MENDIVVKKLPLVSLPWLLLMLSICITILILIYFAGENSNVKEKYSLEGKILLNQLEEHVLIRAGEIDLNDWLALHNQYLEDYYNLLLKYNDSSLSSSVYSIELCLQEYYEMTEQEDVNSLAVDEKIDVCNKLRVDIEYRQYELLAEKLGVEKK